MMEFKIKRLVNKKCTFDWGTENFWKWYLTPKSDEGGEIVIIVYLCNMVKDLEEFQLGQEFGKV